MLQIKNVKKRYDRFVLDASIEVGKGRITGIAGKKGAGKTTIVKTTMGLVRPDSGKVFILGKEPSALKADDREKIGVSFADSGFNKNLTLVDTAKILDRMYSDFSEQTYIFLCRKQGMTDNKPLKELSEGMQAKLRVITALCHRAWLLILDEPTRGMNQEERESIHKLLRAYLAENERRAILITGEMAEDIEELCDDVYVLDEGKVKLHENVKTIRDEYAVIKLNKPDFKKLDQTHMLASKKESYGYACLVKEKAYYQKQYPGKQVEDCSIDALVELLSGGE